MSEFLFDMSPNNGDKDVNGYGKAWRYFKGWFSV
jgi:hypothetical protein